MQARVRWTVMTIVMLVWPAAFVHGQGQAIDGFGLDVVDGFYTGGGHDVLVKAASNKGGHGFGPDRTALHSSLVMAGPAVTRRGSVGVVQMTQIAPTLAAILDVRLAADAAPALDIAAAATTAR